MAGTLKIQVTVDAKEVVADLDAIKEGLGDSVRDVLVEGARRIATDARPLVAGQPPWAGSKGRHAEIVTYSGRQGQGTLSAYVTSLHPGAQVLEWGGTIHPNRPGLAGALRRMLTARMGAATAKHVDRGIQIPRKQAVHRAGDANEDAITRELQVELDRLIAEHGLSG